MDTILENLKHKLTLTKELKNHKFFLVLLFLFIVYLYLVFNNILGVTYYDQSSHQDVLQSVSFYKYIFLNGFDIQNWYPGPANHILDYLLHSFILLVTDNIILSYFIFSLLIEAFLFYGLYILYKNLEETFIYFFLFNLIVLNPIGFHHGILYPSFHSTALFLGFFLLIFLVDKLINKKFGFSFYLALFLSLFLGHSDPFFFIWFIFPLSLVLLYQFRKKKIPLLYISGFIFLCILVFMTHKLPYAKADNNNSFIVLTTYIGASISKYINGLFEVRQFFNSTFATFFSTLNGRDISSSTNNALVFYTFFIYLNWILYLKSSKLKNINNKKDLLILIASVSLITNIGFMYVFKLWNPRYLIPILLLPIVLLGITFNLKNYYKQIKITIFLLFIGTVIIRFGNGQNLNFIIPKEINDSFTKKVEKVANEYNVQNGAGSYWDRKMNLISSQLTITPYFSGAPYLYAAPKEIFKHDIEFVIVRKDSAEWPNQKNALTIFGEPKKIIELEPNIFFYLYK